MTTKQLDELEEKMWAACANREEQQVITDVIYRMKMNLTIKSVIVEDGRFSVD